VGAQFLSIGKSTEPDTHGREAALPAPTPIREGRTRRRKCYVSSWSIRSHSTGVRISPFLIESLDRKSQTVKHSNTVRLTFS
jgi:hypothetical protein